jgi:Tfp pilus assembly protein PilE
MIRARANRRGFSLVELMNFLALAALLAALGMYGLARYVRHSKTAEAVGNITAIGEGAALFFNQSDAHQPAGTRPEQAKAMRHFPPPSRQTVPVDAEDVRGKRYQSTIGDWSVSPWTEMQFKITTPQCYAYGFDAQGSGAAAQATVSAHGDLDGNHIPSTYRVTVAPNDQLDAQVSTTLEKIDPEE